MAKIINIQHNAIKNLILSIIGKDQFGSLLPLVKLIDEYHGNIYNCKINQLGSHFTCSIAISGQASDITRIEQDLKIIESELSLQIISQVLEQSSIQEHGLDSVINFTPKNSKSVNKTKKTKSKNNEDLKYLPYHITINNLNEPGLLAKITEFFILQDISIQDLSSSTYEGEYGSELVQMNIKIKVPSDIHIPSLKEQFDILCYNENLDASLSPHKAI